MLMPLDDESKMNLPKYWNSEMNFKCVAKVMNVQILLHSNTIFFRHCSSIHPRHTTKSCPFKIGLGLNGLFFSFLYCNKKNKMLKRSSIVVSKLSTPLIHMYNVAMSRSFYYLVASTPFSSIDTRQECNRKEDATKKK